MSFSSTDTNRTSGANGGEYSGDNINDNTSSNIDRSIGDLNDNPDLELVTFVCHGLLPCYHLNETLLKNWQLELRDAVSDPDSLSLIIAEHLVLGVNSNCTEIKFNNYNVFLSKLLSLENSIYTDLKVILLEILIYVVTDSYNLRVRLFNTKFHYALLDTFSEIVSRLEITVTKDTDVFPIRDPVSDQCIRLMLLFLELGSDINYVKKIITPLFVDKCTTSKIMYLELFQLLLQTYPAHFKFAIFNTSTSFPFTNNEVKKTLSIHSWFKVNRRLQENDDPITIFMLSNSDTNSTKDSFTTLRVYLVAYNQFMVEIRNNQNNSKMRFMFNQILQEQSGDDEAPLSGNMRNQGFVHFVLTYDSYGNLNLFLNGEYSESIPCPDVRKALHSWNKVTIGNENRINPKSSDEILFKNLTVLNMNLSPEWISLLYTLGLEYTWDFKEFTKENLLNLTNHLTHRKLMNLGMKNKQLQQQKNDSIKITTRRANKKFDTGEDDIWSTSNFMKRNLLHTAPVLSERQTSPQSSFDFSNKDLIVESLSLMKQDMVLFDTNEYFETFGNQQKHNHYSQETQFLSFPSYVYHNSISIHSALHCVGGTALLLKQIESSIEIKNEEMRDSMIFHLLSTLLVALENDWRLSKEFENLNGYGLLSIMLTSYKENHNSSLSLKLVKNLNRNKFLEDTPGLNDSNILNILLSCNGFDFINPYESLILNTQSYKFLILNLDFFLGTDSFEFLLYHLQVLIGTSKFKSYNIAELKKLKLLKRFVQLLKNPKLLSNNSQSLNEQIESTLRCILNADASTETIKTLSSYVIFALYNDDSSSTHGVIVLSILTEILCDKSSSVKTLKKFSRSITVHWILLLFNVQIPEVAQCGLKLLTKLLKSLGPNIIKRFFKVNHGQEILTQFLKHWWKDDRILTSIFLAGFGIDSINFASDEMLGGNRLDLIGVLECQKQFNQLLMPEFLLILTNVILNSMYTLNLKSGKLLTSNPTSPTKSKIDSNLDLKLDVLHVVNGYIESIKIGFNVSSVLNSFYTTKDFLEGIFELLAYLKLTLTWDDAESRQRLHDSYKQLVNVLSEIFISCVSKNTMTDIFAKLNDITKKLMLDLIFPKIFAHSTEFLSMSNFIYDENNYLESLFSTLNCYHNEFLKQNYYVSNDDLESFVSCMLICIELSKKKSLAKEKNSLGDVILLKFLKLAEECENSGTDTALWNSYLKLLLYRQMTVFSPEVLDSKKLADLLNLVLGAFIQFSEEKRQSTMEYTCSFLRTWYLMDQENIKSVVRLITSDLDLIIEFLDNLLSKNDEETLSRLFRYPTMTKIITRNFQSLISAYKRKEYLHLNDMISVTLHNGGRLDYMDNVYTKSFERDCELLKSRVVHDEIIKYNRVIQDEKENIQFFIAGYNLLKVEIIRLIRVNDKIQNYTLDYIESHDRMRKRLIIEDQLPKSEKFSYNFTVPTKVVDSVEPPTGVDEYDILTIDALDSLEIATDGSLDNDDLENETSHNDESTRKINYEDRNRKVIRSLFMGDQITALWNVTEINGLIPLESLMILGISHIYLIENYFHGSDGNVIDVVDAPKNLRDPILQLVSSQSSNMLKDDRKSHHTKSWSLENLSSISKRSFLLRDIALEMFFSDGASILITCLTTKERDAIYHKLSSYASGIGLDNDLIQALNTSTSLLSSTTQNGSLFLASKIALAFSHNPFIPSLFQNVTKKWRMGELSNFYYLMIINTIAGRTFNDLSQYPVFPWVIADYESETLDLSNPKSYRDLSKPMGAQTPGRAQQFKERYDALASLDDKLSPPFHYGTHYSSAMIVTSYLIRLRPFVQSYLVLQGGKFDHADRLFNSIDRAWKSASHDNTTDVRELTPEFFFLPEFLINSNNFEFGKLQSGEVSNDVILPPWAKGDPKIFIAKNREALESPYVSANLNLWIDLVFGIKQSGEEAVSALNVFHHLSYNGAINLDNINDEVEKRAIIGMINNFGQTPTRIFNKPHPSREVLNTPSYYLNLVNIEEPPKLVFESKLQAPIQKLEISSKSSKKWVGRPSCIVAEDDLLIRKPMNFRSASKSLIINQTTFHDIQLSNITYILQIGNKMFMTGSENGTINVWKVFEKPTLSLQFQAVLRGHFSTITELKYSKSFKIGVSVDNEGNVIVWDTVRFKYMRKLEPPTGTIKQTFTSISNDSGNIAIGFVMETETILHIYTINGSPILTKRLDFTPRAVGCINFATINSPTVDKARLVLNNDHTFWCNDMFGVAVGRELKVYEIGIEENGWSMNEIDSISLTKHIQGDITAFELLKCHETDPEEKLCRGIMKLVVGDHTGRVYTL
jgi:hypothetical protein